MISPVFYVRGCATHGYISVALRASLAKCSVLPDVPTRQMYRLICNLPELNIRIFSFAAFFKKLCANVNNNIDTQFNFYIFIGFTL